jgi:hypothetical protein
MNNPLGDFTDEIVESVEYMAKSAKKQITGPAPQASKSQDDTADKKADQKPDPKAAKTDPMTGKPVPTQKTLSQLAQATNQLQMAKLKKLRDEFDKMKLQMTEKGAKPGEPVEEPEKKPPDDAVARTLKSSSQTGEFKGAAGG